MSFLRKTIIIFIALLAAASLASCKAKGIESPDSSSPNDTHHGKSGNHYSVDSGPIIDVDDIDKDEVEPLFVCFSGGAIRWDDVSAVVYTVKIDGEKAANTTDLYFVPSLSAGVYVAEVVAYLSLGSAKTMSGQVEIAVSANKPIIASDGYVISWDGVDGAARAGGGGEGGEVGDDGFLVGDGDVEAVEVGEEGGQAGGEVGGGDVEEGVGAVDSGGGHDGAVDFRREAVAQGMADEGEGFHGRGRGRDSRNQRDNRDRRERVGYQAERWGVRAWLSVGRAARRSRTVRSWPGRRRPGRRSQRGCRTKRRLLQRGWGTTRPPERTIWLP